MADNKDIPKKSLIRNNKGNDTINPDYGKLPPQAKELEEAVLGAIMIEKQAMIEVADILSPESFYLDANQKIYKAIRELHNQSSAIDMLTVVEQLKKNGDLDAVGGPYAIAKLTNTIGSAAHVEEHARIVLEKKMARDMISISHTIITDAYDDTTDPFELHSSAVTAFDSVVSEKGKEISFYDHVTERMFEVGKVRTNGVTPGVKTFIENFDHYLGGLLPGEFIIGAGRPGMGKSALMVDWALNQAKNGIVAGIFSLEMTAAQIIDRMISNVSSIAYEKMRKNSMTDEEYSRYNLFGLEVAELPVLIDDTGGIELTQLVAKAKKWKHKHNLQILYIDYLQLVDAGPMSKGKFSVREQEVSTITMRLKKLAKELHIPVVAFSQLSRKVEERSDKRPMLSDLRESGSLEQNSDIVFFPFRPSYYKLKDDNQQEFDPTYAEIIMGKFRGSSLKDIKTPMQIQYSRFIRGENDMPKGLEPNPNMFSIKPESIDLPENDDFPF